MRIQSMTTSDTRDVVATVAQIKRLTDAGCELVRVTVQGMKEADACEVIKNTLIQEGYTTPLIADIHFYPPAALRVAEFVDKVRINPGNFVDKRASFKQLHYDDQTYQRELDRLEESFVPLVKKCRQRGCALRIGANHGSLSDRIMNRYGDTPAGMVESALEFARVCRKYDYHEIVFSMKASHTRLMIEAYRLLVTKMIELQWNYPLHLGVTEAGEGEDGRVKSAIGIGSLLLDGLGDTIRLSLTEDPWHEILPCQRLIQFAKKYTQRLFSTTPQVAPPVKIATPLHRDGSVFLAVSDEEIAQDDFFHAIGCEQQLGRPMRGVQSVDGILTASQHPKLEALRAAGIALLPLFPTEPGMHFVDVQGDRIATVRRLWVEGNTTPLILRFSYEGKRDEVVIHAAAEMGALLCDKLAQGICLDAPTLTLEQRRTLSFAILQGCRMRASKTEFISCPGCGRTLFELQKVSQGIRAKTAHLPGVKIAIMGCIVNGPGEMADADFGYVGSKSGMIDLYVGRTCVEKNIPMHDAEERLISLIKAHGLWVEPILHLMHKI